MTAKPTPGKQSDAVVAALLRSSDAEQVVRQAVGAALGAALQAKIVRSIDLAGLRALRGDVILLELDSDDASELSTLAEFLRDHLLPPVIVLSPRLDVPKMRELMKIGVFDSIPYPLVAADLNTALAGALVRRRPLAAATVGPRGSVISFLPSAGGVGATSLAVQGACAITQGKHPPSVSVLDLDVQFGAAALLMDAEQRASMIDLVRDPSRLDKELLRSTMVRVRHRFDLLAAPATVHAIDEVDPAAVAAAIGMARETYAHVILDLPPLWSAWTYQALRTSDLIVLVVELSVPSLRQGRRQIQMLAQEALDQIPLVIVANKASGGLFQKSGVSLKEAAKALGRKVDHMIPGDDAMRAAADAGLPLSEVRGGRTLQKKIAAMMHASLKVAAAQIRAAHEGG